MISQTVVSFDKTKIFSVSVLPTEGQIPLGTIFWLHGAFEHCLRYAEVMDYFAKLGYRSIGFDLRGHGQSGGEKLFVKNFLDYSQDLKAVYKHYLSVRKEPIYLIAHSMGGLIAVRSIQEFATDLKFSKIILTAPLIGISAEVPLWKSLLASIVVKIYPQLSLPTNLNSGDLSHDIEVCKKYDSDPKISKIATAGWFDQLKIHQKLAMQKASSIELPMYILQAGEDRVVDNKASSLFFSLLKSNPKELFTYDSMFHEILNEIEKIRVWDDIAAILKR